MDVKPGSGLAVTTDGSVWGVIGVLVDVTCVDGVVRTGSFAPGLCVEGGGKDLGHVVGFRSQVELGYQFDNRTRLALAFSHASNAHLDGTKPGVEVLSLYYHLPLDVLF